MALNREDIHIYRVVTEAVSANFTSALFLVVKYATRVADAHAKNNHDTRDEELDNLVEAVRELGTSQP